MLPLSDCMRQVSPVFRSCQAKALGGSTANRGGKPKSVYDRPACDCWSWPGDEVGKNCWPGTLIARASTVRSNIQLLLDYAAWLGVALCFRSMPFDALRLMWFSGIAALNAAASRGGRPLPRLPG